MAFAMSPPFFLLFLPSVASRPLPFRAATASALLGQPRRRGQRRCLSPSLLSHRLAAHSCSSSPRYPACASTLPSPPSQQLLTPAAPSRCSSSPRFSAASSSLLSCPCSAAALLLLYCASCSADALPLFLLAPASSLYPLLFLSPLQQLRCLSAAAFSSVSASPRTCATPPPAAFSLLPPSCYTLLQRCSSSLLAKFGLLCTPASAASPPAPFASAAARHRPRLQLLHAAFPSLPSFSSAPASPRLPPFIFFFFVPPCQPATHSHTRYS